MLFGAIQLFRWPTGQPAQEVYQESLRFGESVEALGFDAIWLSEHHFTDYAVLGQPLLWAASLAQRTRRIRIGTAVVVLPFHHPLRVAEDAAVVDLLSEGRLDLGVGRGFQPAEFAGFQIAPEEALARFDESLDLLVRAWTTESLSFAGRFYQVEQLRVLPKPDQQPHPPIWLAAVSDDSFERAGRFGYSLLVTSSYTPVAHLKPGLARYRAALRAHGHDAQTARVALVQPVYVALTKQAARWDAEKYLVEYFYRLGQLIPGAYRTKPPAGYEFYETVWRNLTQLSYEELLAGGVIFGTPSDVVQRLKRLETELGIDQLIGWFNFGGMPPDLVRSSLDLFAHRVLPEFRRPGARRFSFGAAASLSQPADTMRPEVTYPDPVDEASAESFPASDPPAWIPVRHL